MSETHYIYRLYNEKDQLLYVGITNDVNRRMAEHRASQEWFGLVVREEREKFICDRSEIEAQERRAIKREKPIYNKIHNVFGFGGRMDSRKKTKGILFRMEPRLYEALARLIPSSSPPCLPSCSTVRRLPPPSLSISSARLLEDPGCTIFVWAPIRISAVFRAIR